MIVSICQLEVQLECLVALALFFVWICLVISDRCFPGSHGRVNYVQLDQDMSKISNYWGPDVININHEVRNMALLRSGNMVYPENRLPQTQSKKSSTSFKVAGACMGFSDCFSNCGLNFSRRYTETRKSFSSSIQKFWAYMIGLFYQMLAFFYGVIVSFFCTSIRFVKLVVSKVYEFILSIFAFIGSLGYLIVEGLFSFLLYIKGMFTFERSSVKETYHPHYRQGRSRRLRSFEMKYGEIEDSFPVYHANPSYEIQHAGPNYMSPENASHSKRSHVFGSFAAGAGFQGHGKSQGSFSHLRSHQNYPWDENERATSQEEKRGISEDSAPEHAVDPKHHDRRHNIIPGRGNHGNISHIFGSFASEVGLHGQGQANLSFGHQSSIDEHPIDKGILRGRDDSAANHGQNNPQDETEKVLPTRDEDSPRGAQEYPLKQTDPVDEKLERDTIEPQKIKPNEMENMSPNLRNDRPQVMSGEPDDKANLPKKTDVHNTGKKSPEAAKSRQPKDLGLKSSASFGAGMSSSFALSLGFDLQHQKDEKKFKILEKKSSHQKFIVN